MPPPRNQAGVVQSVEAVVNTGMGVRPSGYQPTIANRVAHASDGWGYLVPTPFCGIYSTPRLSAFPVLLARV